VAPVAPAAAVAGASALAGCVAEELGELADGDSPTVAALDSLGVALASLVVDPAEAEPLEPALASAEVLVAALASLA
jgi:hypothetical protein